MTDNELNIFREALRYLPFNGISLKEFAKVIHISPHTLYNYICGQRPSYKHYQYILYVMNRDYPAAVAEGKEISKRKGGHTNEKGM